MPGLLRRVEPEYPIEAAKRGVTGYVVLDAVIDKSGKVRDPADDVRQLHASVSGESLQALAPRR